MKHKVTCNHPYLFPTQWNQPKPETWEGETCDCGMNWDCPICGYGQTVYPCNCHREVMRQVNQSNDVERKRDETVF